MDTTNLRIFQLPKEKENETLKTTKQICKPVKQPRIRKAADAWSTVDKTQLCPMLQLEILQTNTQQQQQHPLLKEMKKQITNKIHSYRSQDIKKNLLQSDNLVDTEFVLNLLIQTQLKCFYCKEQTFVLYDEVRAAKQWTLDRIDNSRGHNKDNVEIACLNCNLRRRTMYHERYVFTKQLNIVKLLD
jgi:5-methylcytosine-specific restriction endonuclease McrA